jgi:hypothetical protein
MERSLLGWGQWLGGNQKNVHGAGLSRLLAGGPGFHSLAGALMARFHKPFGHTLIVNDHWQFLALGQFPHR